MPAAAMKALVARDLIRRATQFGVNDSRVKRFAAATLRKKIEAVSGAFT